MTGYLTAIKISHARMQPIFSKKQTTAILIMIKHTQKSQINFEATQDSREKEADTNYLVC